MNTKKYVAFDLGNSKIAAMGAEVLPDGTIGILGVESVAANCLKHGIITNISDAAMQIGTVKKYLQNSAKIAGIKGFGLAINARTMKATEVSIHRQLKSGKAIMFKQLLEMANDARNHYDTEFVTPFDIIPQTYLLDGIAADNPENMKGKSLTGRYTVVYGDKTIKNNIDKTAPRSISAIEFDCIASEALAAALLTDDDRERGSAIIDFGAGNTTLSVYIGGVLKDLLVVPLGGKNITADIMDAGADAGTAETLKHRFPFVDIEFPQGIDNKLLGLIIESRLEEIVVPILDVIKKYEKKLGAGIVLTGGGSTPDYLTAYINEKTGIATRRGSHIHLLAETSKKYDSPALSLLVGIIVLWHAAITENQTESNKPKQPKFGSPVKWFTKNLNIYFPDNIMEKFFSDNSL